MLMRLYGCARVTIHLPHRLASGIWPVLLLAAVAAGGCAPRPGPQVLSVVPATSADVADTVTVHVATTRQRDQASGSYSDGRSPSLSFEDFTVSIPRSHQVTDIEWPTAHPDPATSFAVTERKVQPKFEVAADPVRPGQDGRATARRDVVIFVHGYNYNFPESLFRLAQIAADGKLEEAPILFAWPSAATVTGYVADRDAITYSRDGLVQFLTMIDADPRIGRVTLFGHSMGAMLVTESLRQLRLTGQGGVVDRLDEVVLAAPDIDIDVFRSQMDVIGPLDPPMTILVSPDDRALLASGRLAGSRSRLGTRDVSDPRVQALAKAHKIQIIDISAVSTPDGTNHSRFAGLVTVFPRMQERGGSALAQAGAFVLEPLTASLVRPGS